MLPRFWLCGAVAALAVSATGARAAANPRPLPFTYQHEQLQKDATELEQYVDLVPVRAYSASSGDRVWYGLSQFQTEFEHGLTDRLELGLYVTLVPAPTSGFASIPRGTEGNGMKQRLRYQLAPTGDWPIDVGLYGEVSENEREVELEGKVILQRRLGPLRLIANATAEQEIYYGGTRDFVLTPSAGATVEITPTVQPGLEWWMHAEYPEQHPPSPRPFGLGPHHYLGPALLLEFGQLWWSTGVYFRLSDRNHTLQPAETFGNIWVRSVLGIGF